MHTYTHYLGLDVPGSRRHMEIALVWDLCLKWSGDHGHDMELALMCARLLASRWRDRSAPLGTLARGDLT